MFSHIISTIPFRPYLWWCATKKVTLFRHRDSVLKPICALEIYTLTHLLAYLLTHSLIQTSTLKSQSVRYASAIALAATKSSCGSDFWHSKRPRLRDDNKHAFDLQSLGRVKIRKFCSANQLAYSIAVTEQSSGRSWRSRLEHTLSTNQLFEDNFSSSACV